MLIEKFNRPPRLRVSSGRSDDDVIMTSIAAVSEVLLTWKQPVMSSNSSWWHSPSRLNTPRQRSYKVNTLKVIQGQYSQGHTRSILSRSFKVNTLKVTQGQYSQGHSRSVKYCSHGNNQSCAKVRVRLKLMVPCLVIMWGCSLANSYSTIVISVYSLAVYMELSSTVYIFCCCNLKYALLKPNFTPRN